jgi:hypothetical protein
VTADTTLLLLFFHGPSLACMSFLKYKLIEQLQEDHSHANSNEQGAQHDRCSIVQVDVSWNRVQRDKARKSWYFP